MRTRHAEEEAGQGVAQAQGQGRGGRDDGYAFRGDPPRFNRRRRRVLRTEASQRRGAVAVRGCATCHRISRRVGSGGYLRGFPDVHSRVDGGGGDEGSTGGTNLGGGGGANAAGGSGVVILRYPNTRTLTASSGLTSTTATDGNDKVTTFTAGTGTISFT